MRQEHRYDSAGRPIYFRCQGAGNVARICRGMSGQTGSAGTTGPVGARTSVAIEAMVGVGPIHLFVGYWVQCVSS